jgi:16S rRNA (uracil1498-N3)-methyltransferase
MTRRRWIADEVSEDRAALTGEHADHLVRVLRVRVGQEFDIAAGTSVRRGQVIAIDDRRVEFQLGEEVPTATAMPVILLLSIFKFDRMEWAIEKCTELGVSRIVPVIAKRTDARLAAASLKRVERWRRLSLQASEQSRRAAAPEIVKPLKLKEAAGLVSGLRIVLAESEQEGSLRDALQGRLRGETGGPERAPHTGIALAVGPEGGWTEDELQTFAKAGWISASLGSAILRAETAAIAATAIVLSELG